MLSMHFRQMFRKSGRIVLYILILALLTAFFCTSLNLYVNSINNLQRAEETYTTIGVVELYAETDEYGNLTDDILSENYIGYHTLTVNGYDFYPLTTAANVIKYDLRATYGAYSEENIRLDRDEDYPAFEDDVIRFRINEEDNSGRDAEFNKITLYTDDNGNFRILDMDQIISEIGYFDYQTNEKRTDILLDVLESATDCFTYEDRIQCINIELYGYGWNNEERLKHMYEKYADEIESINFNFEEGYAGLEPGVEYIGVLKNAAHRLYRIYENNFNSYIASDGKYKGAPLSFYHDYLFNELYFVYSNRATALGEETRYQRWSEDNPFWLVRFDYVQSDPELKAKYEQISYAYHINARSFGVVALDDMMGVPAFHMGNIYMREGRNITDEEFASGADVCIVSAELAQKQGWSLGDKISFDFYEYDYFTKTNGNDTTLAPLYRYTERDQFFDGGEYEIVGIFDVKPLVGNTEISYAAASVPWNTIYVPEKSLENAPAEETRQVSGSLLTLWIENGKVNDFLESAEETGIFDRDDYDVKITFYDQGYSRIQPSLETLSGTAELLLILSSALLVIATIMIAFFYANSQKQCVGTMRLLGCSKAQCFAAVLLSALLIVLVGAAAGSITGHMLTEDVGEEIMTESNATPEEFLAFSAYIIGGNEVHMEITVGAEKTVSTAAFALAAGLFMLSAIAFVLRYIGREPRELLPRTGE